MESAGLKEAKKMTQISSDYGVLCSETTLVAVEKLKEKVEGEAKAVIIPIAITKDSQLSDNLVDQQIYAPQARMKLMCMEV